MNISQTGHLTSEDGLRLQWTHWSCPKTPRGVIMLVHGYRDYGLLFDEFAQELANQYVVYTLDYRGHGHSTGPRALFTIPQVASDLHLLHEQIAADHPELPIFLYGHSMGTLVMAEYALRYQQDLAGLIFTANVVFVTEQTQRWMWMVAALLNRIAPTLTTVDAAKPGAASRDPAVDQQLFNDPLWYRGGWRGATLHSMFATSKDVQPRLHEITIPTLILHGSADQVTLPLNAERLYDAIDSEDKTLHLFPDMMHVLHKEIDKERVWQTAIDWLDNHTAARA